MLVVISPAKTLDFDTPVKSSLATQPAFLDDAEHLVTALRELEPAAISGLMNISAKLGDLNHARYMNWQRPFTAANSKQALLAFKGDVYTGLQAETLSAADLKFAQQHLRILSGLYGLLRPMDLIQPYRLEMATRFANDRGANLYDYWGDQLTAALNQQLGALKSDLLVNLASNEYFKAIRPGLLDAQVITPVFKDAKNGKYKIISFYAKKARGMMTAYIIRNRISAAEQLQGFNEQGYLFSPEQSTATEWVFLREQPPE